MVAEKNLGDHLFDLYGNKLEALEKVLLRYGACFFACLFAPQLVQPKPKFW